MKKIGWIGLFYSMALMGFSQQQTTSKLVLDIDLSNLKKLPVNAVIERTNLGGYEKAIDTNKITKKIFKYETKLSEPNFLKITFYWQDKNTTSISFWALPLNYQIIVNNDLKTDIQEIDESKFVTKITGLEKMVKDYGTRLDSLVKNINYENQKIKDVERRIGYLKDSINEVIDENIYKKTMLANLNSPIGLFALCKYAERPYANQRMKTEPSKIKHLFNQLSYNIKQLPSAKILFNKLSIGQQMAIGNVLKDISLPDTVNKIFKISDFRGKYLLIDFWASWCVSCREENPSLINAYKKYKNQGFEIMSITSDEISSKKNWKKAIIEDHTNIWTQLSDFKNVAQKQYDIRFIPANYLIDKNGVIIAKNLRGEELESKLKEIFKF